MDPVLKAQCNQTVEVKFTTGLAADIYGQVPVGTATSFLCRVEPDTRSEDRFVAGSENRTNYLVIMDETVTGLTLESQLWLPGTSSSSSALARRPKKIQAFYDENGALAHWEVYV